MIVKDFLQLYKEDSYIQHIASQISRGAKGESIFIKGLTGALDTVLMA